MRAALILTIFICGVLIGFQTPHIWPAISIIFTAAGILCLTIFIQPAPQNIYLRQRLSISGAAFLIFGGGILDGTLNYFDNTGIVDGNSKCVTGIVESRRTLSNSEMYTLNLRAIDGKREKGELVFFTSPEKVYCTGDMLNISTPLITDSSSSKLQRKLIADGFTENVKKIGESTNLRYRFLKVRESIDQMIGTTRLSHDTKALIRALIIADRTEISKFQTDTFRNGGVIHVLAVSGMHIAIIATVLLLLTRPIAALTGRKLRLILILSGIWIFIMITGAAYPTIRAGVMISVVTVALILERRRDPFSAVCLAALFIVAVRPSSIADVGFQLSFVSVASLSLIADHLNPIDHRKHPKTYKLFSIILSTIIATGSTWLICGYYFGSVAIRFVPSNIILLPLLPFYVGAAIIYIFLSYAGMEFTLFTVIMDSVPRIITKILSHITVPALKLEVGIWTVIIWMVALTAFSASLNTSRKQRSIANQFETLPTQVNLPLFITSVILASIALILLPYHI